MKGFVNIINFINKGAEAIYLYGFLAFVIVSSIKN
jgi:hypothetical protein